ncbi:major facilitator superfamily domain-containing protein [Coniella lustricola]|uniref:Major facilitator superfamily domain-containing protein n=1 Tax=Coniella lustricola TaxID=2025994 RepID=A0A2T3A299_9PEZI|nr:major facilitator superfamily domain-containing protein [Coniella lustricola]
MSNERTSLLEAEGSGDDDTNVVFWVGPDDAENPINWPKEKTWGHIALISILTFLIPLGMTMFAPALQNVLQDFGSTDRVLASLSISIYVLGWALGPLIVAPLSEVHGRLVIYTWSNILYVFFTVGCALAPTLRVLVLLRFLCGAVGSTPLTIGGGTISDIVPIQKRGLALSLYMFGPILGPSVGPLLGGFITDMLGWRWIFWTLAIIYSAMTLLQILLMRETYAARILQHRTNKLRQQTGNINLRSKLDDDSTGYEILVRAIVRPAKITIYSPLTLVLSLASAYLNGVVFLLLTTAPIMFHSIYGFSPKAVGIALLGYGIGNLVGLLIFTLTSDRLVRRQPAVAAKQNRPENRIIPILGALPLIFVGLLWYGWSAATGVHWMLAITGSALIGAGNVLFMSTVTGYLIDCFGAYAASAIAANTVLRSLGGTLLPLIGADLFAAIGWGWGNSVLALVAVLLTPAMLYLYLRGESLRAKHSIAF